MSEADILFRLGLGPQPTPTPNSDLSAPSQQSAKSESNSPDAWLLPLPDQYVIDEDLWNKEAAPVHLRTKFYHSVRWTAWHGRFYLRSMTNAPRGGLLLRGYFGIEGCIIPIACVIDLDTHDTVVFTLAGPNEPGGTRRFYFMKYPSDSSLQDFSDAHLAYFPANFSSVCDFHTNWANTPLIWLEPVEGGSERMVAGLKRARIPPYHRDRPA
ncbi:hypothetical protein C8R44DRAFT_797578 [Mycena epipterygia]|nr:hypothetical protein C8R44DRAFT_797578 [Mycena epipterygia]